MAFKPSSEEEKWAKQLELDLRQELTGKLSSEEKQKFKKSWSGRCPSDGAILAEEFLDGTNIKIKKCPICRGIWLDHIQMEKLLQMSKESKHFIEFLDKILNVKV